MAEKLKFEDLKMANGGYIKMINYEYHVFDDSTEYDIITYRDLLSARQADRDLHSLEFKDRMAANILVLLREIMEESIGELIRIY